MSNKTSDVGDPSDHSHSHHSGSGICHPSQLGQSEFILKMSNHKSSASIIRLELTLYA